MPTTESVPFTFLDKPRALRLDVNAINAIENHFNTNIGQLLSPNRIGYSVITGFLCYGVQWQDRGMTYQRMTNLLHKALTEGRVTIQDAMTTINQALEASGLFTEEEEPAESPVPDPNASPGTAA